MKYVNAAEILPEKLLKEIQTYMDGGVLYIPKSSAKKGWGSVSGSRKFYQKRNKEIQFLFENGYSIETLSKQYGLAHSTLKK
ncbi:MAG: CD3324 family protein [Lachnospiraceae bacterium]|nr:CD3324 family protein [Lachnospiraceae bacterium]